MKLRTVSVATLVLALGAGTALAGKKLSAQVTVTVFADGSFQAMGGLGSARSSADSTQFILCETFGGVSWRQALCFASDAAGTARSCWSNEPLFVDTASTASGDSWIKFQAPSHGGQCTFIEVKNSSEYLPKSP